MSEFQPPEFAQPELDDEDRMYGALSDLASIDTHDTDLRDHPKAYEVLDRLMTHAYGEGRKDEAMLRVVNPRLMRKIITDHVYPSIPVRTFDWTAVFDGYEPGDSLGTGRTEQEAIDWLIAEEAHLIASEHERAREAA